MNGLIHSVSFFLVLVYYFSYFAYRSPGYGGEDLGGAFYLPYPPSPRYCLVFPQAFCFCFPSLLFFSCPCMSDPTVPVPVVSAFPTFSSQFCFSMYLSDSLSVGIS